MHGSSNKRHLVKWASGRNSVFAFAEMPTMKVIKKPTAKTAKPKPKGLPKSLRALDKRLGQAMTAKGMARLKAENVSIEDAKLLAFRNLARWWSPDGWARECHRRESLGYILKFRNSWWVRRGQRCTIDSKNRLVRKKPMHEVMNFQGVRWGYYTTWC